jgi:hypothetical protein
MSAVSKGNCHSALTRKHDVWVPARASLGRDDESYTGSITA